LAAVAVKIKIYLFMADQQIAQRYFVVFHPCQNMFSEIPDMRNTLFYFLLKICPTLFFIYVEGSNL
jgi:hypothetical protein